MRSPSGAALGLEFFGSGKLAGFPTSSFGGAGGVGADASLAKVSPLPDAEGL